MAAEEIGYLLKVIVLGQSGAGKTSILNRIVEHEYYDSMLPTVGIDYRTVSVKGEGYTVRVQLWDTAGQERYHAIFVPYYRDARGAVLVYDITDRNSFLRIQYWVDLLTQHCNPHNNVVVFLIGNKSDLNGSREVTTEEAEQYAMSHNFAFMETSAKEGTNVKIAFDYLVDKMYVRRRKLAEKEKSETIGGTGKGGKVILGKEQEKKSFCWR